ncbi:hypothetical protein MKEN_00931300 [Mycena kentingensis (nom. inval.)]|nr:hypothetical protein MKEN_00931300 [Mycena kentingensis (nom. inval.)]
MATVYECDCLRYCGGVKKRVSKTTYNAHAPFRRSKLTQSFADFASSAGAPTPHTHPPAAPQTSASNQRASSAGPSKSRSKKRVRAPSPPTANPLPMDGFTEHEQEQYAAPSSPKRARVGEYTSPKVLSPRGSKLVSLHEVLESEQNPDPEPYEDDDVPDPDCFDDPEEDEPTVGQPPVPPPPPPPPASPPPPPAPGPAPAEHPPAPDADDVPLWSVMPELDPEKPLPVTAIDLGDGRVLLRARDRYRQRITGRAGQVVRAYVEQHSGEQYADRYTPALLRWARMRLPNGQIARSAWKESHKGLTRVRMARNVRYLDEELDSEAYAEVQFFFQSDLEDEPKTLALVSVYSAPDTELLAESNKTLWVCKYRGEESLKIIDVRAIASVVAMVPYDETRVFAVHKMGLEVGEMVGYMEKDNEEDSDDEEDDDE